MNIKEKTVFHICRHKELANILKEDPNLLNKEKKEEGTGNLNQ